MRRRKSRRSGNADDHGLVFATDAQGRRSSATLSVEVFARALAELSPSAAQALEQDPHWHRHYPVHLRALLDESHRAGTPATIAAAHAGLDALHTRLRFVRDGRECALASLRSLARKEPFATESLTGDGDCAPRPLQIPLGDEMLSGDRLARQLDQWERRGIIEPSHAHAVRSVLANPDWLDLSDQCFALLGSSSEVGPLAWLSGWRARILAIDLPTERSWRRFEKLARRGNATLLLPVRHGQQHPGANLLIDLPELLDWLAPQAGPMMIGAYAYLDGAEHVRVSAAMDWLTAELLAQRPDLSLSMLATPSDVYRVPAAAVSASRDAYDARGLGARLWQWPLQLLSGGKLLRPNYPLSGTSTNERAAESTELPTLCDSLVIQQGVNYALAKRIQQWRALSARAAGRRVSINIAPSTMSHSVIRNPALKAAFGGARLFGVEGFDPATTSALMAALLVYDLRSDESLANPALPLEDPSALLMQGANHGGMWRMPFSARSALPLAALFGLLRRGEH